MCKEIAWKGERKSMLRVWNLRSGTNFFHAQVNIIFLLWIYLKLLERVTIDFMFNNFFVITNFQFKIRQQLFLVLSLSLSAKKKRSTKNKTAKGRVFYSATNAFFFHESYMRHLLKFLIFDFRGFVAFFPATSYFNFALRRWSLEILFANQFKKH